MENQFSLRCSARSHASLLWTIAMALVVGINGSNASADEGAEPVRVFTGTVVDEAGAPIADALVEWGHFEAEQSEREFTHTNAAGEYRLETMRAWQDFRLGVHKSGFGPRWVDGLIPSRDGSVMDFALPPSGTVTGVVVYPSGEPCQGSA